MRSTSSRFLGECTLAAAGLLPLGCASGPTGGASPGVMGAPLSWRLEGARIIAYCCATPCPCRLNKAPMHCHGCDFTTAVHIDKGEIDGVRMDGLDWVFVGRVFAEDPGTNWHYLYVSDKATDEQLNALKKLLDETAQAVEAKRQHLLGEAKGMRKAPIKWSVSADGRDWATTVPGVLEVKTRSIIVPGQKEAVVSTGIFDDYGNRFTHADCLTHTLNDKSIGSSWDLTGRQGNQAKFALDHEKAGRGGIGWGCWSANSQLGGDAHYQEKMIGHK
jgi:hypothetical protein